LKHEPPRWGGYVTLKLWQSSMVCDTGGDLAQLESQSQPGSAANQSTFFPDRSVHLALFTPVLCHVRNSYCKQRRRDESASKECFDHSSMLATFRAGRTPASPITPLAGALLQPRVLGFGLLQDGDVGVGTFIVDSGLAAPRTCSGTVSLPIAIR
jgi:hypothetical protein